MINIDRLTRSTEHKASERRRVQASLSILSQAHYRLGFVADHWPHKPKRDGAGRGEHER